MQNGLLIAQLRCQKGLTQAQVAKMLNVCLSTYKNYEIGIRPMRLQEANILSDFYQVSLNSLLNLTINTKSYNNFAIDYKYLNFNLKRIRRLHRVSQKSLAAELNLSINTICKYEKNSQFIKTDYLYYYAKKFKVSIDYISGKTLKKEVF